jgi:nucleoside-diphosphate kinase
MIEKTLFIIKPDGWSERAKILDDISKQFNIVHTEVFDFSPDLTAKFYFNDIGKPYYSAIEEYMVETPCQLGIIEGNTVIENFFQFAGKLSDPKDCAVDTLRYKYGKGLDTTTSGLYIVKNAVHRAKSKEEYNYEKELLKLHNIL